MTVKDKIDALWYGCIERTAVGPVWIAVSQRGLVALEITPSPERFLSSLEEHYGVPLLREEGKTEAVVQQIREYLEGKRQSFDFAIDWSVLTDFQAQVLKATAAIPYGETTTYTQIAVEVGKPKAARAVGRAEATNPIPLVLPCHRVVGKDGSLRGYGSGEGLKTKAWLINFEKGNKLG